MEILDEVLAAESKARATKHLTRSERTAALAEQRQAEVAAAEALMFNQVFLRLAPGAGRLQDWDGEWTPYDLGSNFLGTVRGTGTQYGRFYLELQAVIDGVSRPVRVEAGQISAGFVFPPNAVESLLGLLLGEGWMDRKVQDTLKKLLELQPLRVA